MVSIKDAMENWRDNTQGRLPGFRERIIDIKLGHGEGGLNLAMDKEKITSLTARGAFAGDRLKALFSGEDDDNPAPTKHWNDSLFTRFRVTMSVIEEALRAIRRGYNAQADAVTVPYPERIAEGGVAPYRLTEAELELAQETIALSRPVATGLDERIRDLITQEHYNAWPFRLSVALMVILIFALFGIDWIYANKAKQIIADMNKEMDQAKSLLIADTSELKKAIAGMQQQVDSGRSMVSQKDAELKKVVGDARTAIDNAGSKGVEDVKAEMTKVTAAKVAEARAQKLEIAQIPWTGWLLGNWYGVALLSLVFSFLATGVAFFKKR